MSQHLISTRAVEVDCPQCQQPVLRAVDEGLPAVVDATPINPTTELHTLLDNRRTYARLHCRELAHRHAGRIRHGLVGDAIHAEHICPTVASQPDLFVSTADNPRTTVDSAELRS